MPAGGTDLRKGESGTMPSSECASTTEVPFMLDSQILWNILPRIRISLSKDDPHTSPKVRRQVTVQVDGSGDVGDEADDHP